MTVALAIIIGLLRIMGITAAWYQAVAHLFVGGLFGAWWVNRKSKFMDVKYQAITNLILAVGLSVLEVVCFLVFRFAV